MKRLRPRGFSLIELMVVISIITLISSIALAAFKNARDKAIDSNKVTLAKQYINALALYSNEWGSYPYVSQDIGDVRCLGTNNPGGTCLGNKQESTGFDNLNSKLAPYIPGPPAQTDPVLINNLDFGGIGYICLPTPFLPDICNNYALVWVMKGPNGNGCAGGFVDNSDQIGLITAVPSTNALCVYTTDFTTYASIYHAN